MPGKESELPGCTIQLLPDFGCVVDGVPVVLPAAARRLIVRLAVAYPGLVSRADLVDDLDLTRTADPRAYLRKALWQINDRVGRAVVTATRTHLSLDGAVRVDYDAARQHCQVLIMSGFAPEALTAAPYWLADAVGLRLLAGWDDEWLAPLQQEWDVVRLETLHTIAEAELCGGHIAAALVHAERLVRDDPLREGAWHTLLTALLTSGHRAAAAKRFAELADLLHEELGVGPKPDLRRLVSVAE